MQVRQAAHVRALAQRRKLAARTTSLASAAECTCGAMMPSAPPSSTRRCSPACWRERARTARCRLRARPCRSPRRPRARSRNAPGPRRACRSRRCWRCARSRRAHEPHRHRGHHLVARKLLLDVVAQDVADPHGPAPLLFARPRSRPLALSTRWRYAADVRQGIPSRGNPETIHELHDRLQVDPRPGLGRGMAGARRSRRLLPAGRQIRDDRPHLQPHHGAHSRRRTTCSSTSTACSTRRSRHRAW